MTRDEIMKQKAGRELDILVAQYVFKTEVYEHSWESDGECAKCRCSIDFHSGRVYLHSRQIDKPYCISPDSYSTDIAAAWEVVEKMKEKFSLSLSLNDPPTTKELQWECIFFALCEPWTDGEARAETAPLAICRAALLAVMELK